MYDHDPAPIPLHEPLTREHLVDLKEIHIRKLKDRLTVILTQRNLPSIDAFLDLAPTRALPLSVVTEVKDQLVLMRRVVERPVASHDFAPVDWERFGEQRKIQLELDTVEMITSIATSGEGVCYMGSSRGNLHLVDVVHNDAKKKIPLGGDIVEIAGVTLDGRVMMSVNQGVEARQMLYDPRTESVTQLPPQEGIWYKHTAITASGYYVGEEYNTSTQEDRMRVWDPVTGEELHNHLLMKAPVRDLPVYFLFPDATMLFKLPDEFVPKSSPRSRTYPYSLKGVVGDARATINIPRAQGRIEQAAFLNPQLLLFVVERMKKLYRYSNGILRPTAFANVEQVMRLTDSRALLTSIDNPGLQVVDINTQHVLFHDEKRPGRVMTLPEQGLIAACSFDNGHEITIFGEQ